MSAFAPDLYFRPNSVAEALRLLTEHGGSARVLAGGTALHELAQRGLLGDVRALVDIEDLGLDYVKQSSDRLVIGAAATYRMLFEALAPLRRDDMRALMDAVRAIQPMQVKNVATVGGAVCSGLPFFDLPTALVALEATAQLEGPEGRRLVPLSSFFLDYFVVDIRPNELLTEVRVPLRGDWASNFLKFGITADDWALVNVAVAGRSADGKVEAIRVAAGGGVARTPVRLPGVEAELDGRILSPELTHQAVATALQSVSPISDARASAEYRRHLLGILLARALRRTFSTERA